MTFGPDGAFGMDIHVLEAWTPNLVMEQKLILKVRLFLSGSKSLGLGIWPIRSIWDGHGHHIKSWSKISWRAHFRGQAFALMF